MSNELFVALYVYEDHAQIEVEAPELLRLYRLEPPPNEQEPWVTAKDQTFEKGALSLTNGVYGWYHERPVKLSIEGEVVVVARAAGRGKDPWPPPPPPPPRFADYKARWEEHAFDEDAHFMAAIGFGLAPSSTRPAKRSSR